MDFGIKWFNSWLNWMVLMMVLFKWGTSCACSIERLGREQRRPWGQAPMTMGTTGSQETFVPPCRDQQPPQSLPGCQAPGRSPTRTSLLPTSGTGCGGTSQGPCPGRDHGEGRRLGFSPWGFSPKLGLIARGFLGTDCCPGSQHRLVASSLMLLQGARRGGGKIRSALRFWNGKITPSYRGTV